MIWPVQIHFPKDQLNHMTCMYPTYIQNNTWTRSYLSHIHVNEGTTYNAEEDNNQVIQSLNKDPKF